MQSKAKVSLRGQKIPPSPIRKLSPLAIAAKDRGVHVFGLNIGQPDIPSPELYFEGIRSFTSATVSYEPSMGNLRLCSEWSKYMNRSLGTATAPEQFIITSGASEALQFLFLAIADPGDEVIFFEPTYGNYLGFAAAASILPKGLSCSVESSFTLPSLELIERAVTNKTRAIVVCNPNNPTGTVTPPAKLQELLNLCEERGIFLIVDETYRELVYDKLEFHSVLQDSPRSNSLVIVDSLSKRFSLCGARIGCLITCNEELRSAINRLAMTRLSVSTLEQFAAAHLLEKIKGDFLSEARSEYEKRRNTLCDALARIPNVSFHKPQGAFYLVAKLPVSNSEDFARYLLTDFNPDNQAVFVAPAAGFYINGGKGSDEVRIAYVLNTNEIIRAMQIFSQGLVNFPGRV